MDLPTYSPPIHPPNHILPSEDVLPPAYSLAHPEIPQTAHYPLIGDSTNNESQPSFTIGTRQTKALVNGVDLRAHLRILGAFRRLREEVVTHKPHSPDTPIGEDAWTIYLAKAAYRFESWVKGALRDVRKPENARLSLDEIPPFDVLMVWHVYMLNPRIYYEDGLRMHRGLASRGSFPLHEVAALIDRDTLLPLPATYSRMHHFESRTGLPFQVPTTSTPIGAASVICPSCNCALSVPWTTNDNTGYSQAGFRKVCETCGLVVNTEAIAVAGFCKDVAKVVKKPKTATISIRGTLLDPYSGVISNDAAFFNDNLVFYLSLQTNEQFDPARYAKEVLEWKMEKVEELLRKVFMRKGRAKSSAPNPPGLNRILSLYMAPGSFSIDLVKAVRRHERFTEKMVLMNWTDPDRFEDDDSPLVRCINQYHAFLHLMANNPNDFLVPTLSIDLAWHTHQLAGEAYRKSTLELVRTFVDHDDNVEQQNLATAYDNTAQLWRTAFGVPYSVCGCPLPSQAGRTQSIIKMFSRKGKEKANPASNPRPDLLSRELMDADETHPSEHPAVTLVHHDTTDTLRKERANTITRRIEEASAAVVSGKADQWAELCHERSSRSDHCVSFSDNLKGPATTADWKNLESSHGLCVMGIDKAGLCYGGNYKRRAGVDWEHGAYRGGGGGLL